MVVAQELAQQWIKNLSFLRKRSLCPWQPSVLNGAWGPRPRPCGAWWCRSWCFPLRQRPAKRQVRSHHSNRIEFSSQTSRHYHLKVRTWTESNIPNERKNGIVTPSRFELRSATDQTFRGRALLEPIRSRMRTAFRTVRSEDCTTDPAQAERPSVLA